MTKRQQALFSFYERRSLAAAEVTGIANSLFRASTKQVNQNPDA
jgi:hypothetical protein